MKYLLIILLITASLLAQDQQEIDCLCGIWKPANEKATQEIKVINCSQSGKFHITKANGERSILIHERKLVNNKECLVLKDTDGNTVTTYHIDLVNEEECHLTNAITKEKFIFKRQEQKSVILK